MIEMKYNSLTELLLNIVRQRPGMYLGKNHISKLPNFIIGYQFSDRISGREPDYYFGENGFLEWYCNTYNQPRVNNSWLNYFLLEAKDDEAKALEIYFERLKDYYEWYKSNFVT